MTAPVHQDHSQIDEQAALWCLRLSEGRLDADERYEFDAWIATDDARAMAFEEAVAIWHGVEDVADTPEMIRYRAEAVESLRRANARRWARTHWAMGGWGRAAAAFAAVLLVAMVYLLHDPMTSYSTGTGERRVVMLDDGTRVTLDAATRVNVRMDRNSRRLELVSGRAKFDVAHDAMRPLSVLARNRLTLATGTSFSVELLAEQMRVVLYEGRVEVMAQAKDGTRHTILPVAGQPGPTLVPGTELIASTSATTTSIAPTDISRSLSWESGQLTFDGEPLAVAVDRMNRDAREKLVIADPRIGAYIVNGVFLGADADAFVEGVCALHPVQARREDGRIILSYRAV
jgi:transmembrane sensor